MMKSRKRSAKCSGPTAQGLGHPRSPGQPVRHERCLVVECERREPERRPLRAVRERAGDPERARGDEPDQDAPGPLAFDRAATRGGEREEGLAPDLNRDIGGGEEQRLVAERLGDRDRHQQAGEHERDQQKPDDDRAGIELVRGPCRGSTTTRRRAAPASPDPLLPRQVVQQQVRHLRDGEDEDEVVEELERGRALLDRSVATERGSRNPGHWPSHPRRLLESAVSSRRWRGWSASTTSSSRWATSSRRSASTRGSSSSSYGGGCAGWPFSTWATSF